MDIKKIIKRTLAFYALLIIVFMVNMINHPNPFLFFANFFMLIICCSLFIQLLQDYQEYVEE